MTPKVPPVIYHFTLASYFDLTDPTEDYYPVYYEEEGFIHSTAEPEWVERMANKILGECRDKAYLLEIETAKIKPKTIMEQAKNGHWFPHIFGGLNRDAILRKTTLERGADGLYLFPSEWLETSLEASEEESA